ncbi:MAG: hypothetical protein RLZZ26_443 [Candidatus Parcubacteria bacterium]|jgi:ATP-binding cassette subfamily C protein
MKNTFQLLWRSYGQYRWHILALILLGFVSAILEGIGINAVIPLISFFGGGTSTATDFITNAIRGLFGIFHVPFTFRYLLGFIFVLFILRAASVVVFGYIRGWINADFLAKESEDVMRRTLHSSWAFSLKQKIGTMHNTLVRDVQQAGGLLAGIAQAVQSFSGFLMYLLVAINISPLMTAYSLGGGVVVFLLVRPVLHRSRRIGAATAIAEKTFAQFLSEHIIGMKTVKAAGVEGPAISNGAQYIQELRRLAIRQAFANSLSTSFFQPAALLIVVILFLVTYHSGTFSIISFAASLYLIQKIFTYLESGQNSLQAITSLVPYTQNLNGFKTTLDIHRESSGGHAPFTLSSELAFADVSFSYNEGKPVLDGVSFSIAAGQTVGLVGPSGAGKTSVADLVLRLFAPNAGAILLDGMPSESISLTEWRTHIGYVSQDVFLLNDSIEENIRFYNKALTREDIVAAAKQANIYDFVMGLPEGFETNTGDRGVLLSGGQRQRIALARALAGKPALLLLDEATSALDHESERLIHESIKALHGKVTVLIIAHRPSTVADADTIIVLDHGKVAERGTPHELLQNHHSYFFKMQNA